MIEYLTDIINQYATWFYLMISISLCIGFLASYLNNSGIPFLWTIVLNAVMLYGKEYLEPMISGIWNFDYTNYTVLSIMLFTFSITWLIIMIISHYNLLVYGEVVN